MIDPEELAEHFVSCRLSKQQWTHHAHLAVGLWHVDRFGADAALDRLREGIRRLNDSHGTVNSSTSGYHETITCAYVRLLDQFLARSNPALALRERFVTLVASGFADRDLLFRFYSRDLLMSPLARAEWVPPDLAALSL